MSEQTKQLKTRIIHKHKLEVAWKEVEATFLPKAGELIVYDPEVDAEGNILALPDDRSEPYTASRLKIGDGYHYLKDLEFVSSTCGFDNKDDFVFYCGDSENLTADPYVSAEYIIACGDSDKFIIAT